MSRNFDFILLLLKINEACCVNNGYILRVCVCDIHMKYHQDRFAGYKKHSGVTKGRSGQKTQRLPKFEIDSINTFLNKSCKFAL